MLRIKESFVAYEQEPEEKKATFIDGVVFDFVISAKAAILIVLLLFTFVFRAVGVEGESMIPNLRDGDWIAVTAVMNKTPETGDIVVVTQPWVRNVPIVKRVIAVGGDEVDINFITGDVKINGKVISESYINEATHLRYDVKFPVTVPEGKVFVMGDNRNDSLDSRSSEIGFIDENYILGKAIIRFYPFSEWKIDGQEA